MSIDGLNPHNGLERIILMGGRLREDYRSACLSAIADFSIDQVSQLTFTFLDPDYRLLSEGLFEPTIPLFYGDMRLRIASLEVGDNSNHEQITIAARPDAVRKLKLARGSKVMKNASPTDFVKAECERLGIPVLAQESEQRRQVARDRQRQRDEPYGAGQIPSSWTTFQRFAREVGFVVFEARGKIFFGKPTWLLEHFEDHPVLVYWKTGKEQFRTQYPPTCNKSVDSEEGKTVTVRLPMHRWRVCTPGRALVLKGVPFFDGSYIISSVSYNLSGEGDISVEARKAIDPEPEGWGRINTSLGAGFGAGYSGGRSLRALMQWAGFKGHNLDVAVAVAMAESGGNATIHGDQHLADAKWGHSIGLFQIRSLRNPSTFGGVDRRRIASKLEDAMYNAKTGYLIWKSQGWSPWTTYQTGSYRKYMGRDFQIKNWTPPASFAGGPRGRKSALTFVELALKQKGDRYVLGASPSYKDRNPEEFDCSELVAWAAARVGVRVPGYTASILDLCQRRGTMISVERAIRTRGALLYVERPGSVNHVAISLGNGKTIEAANSSTGVLVMSARGRSENWTHGMLVPGMRY